jgi:hypothetical protein
MIKLRQGITFNFGPVDDEGTAGMIFYLHGVKIPTGVSSWEKRHNPRFATSNFAEIATNKETEAKDTVVVLTAKEDDESISACDRDEGLFMLKWV